MLSDTDRQKSQRKSTPACMIALTQIVMGMQNEIKDSVVLRLEIDPNHRPPADKVHVIVDGNGNTAEGFGVSKHYMKGTTHMLINKLRTMIKRLDSYEGVCQIVVMIEYVAFRHIYSHELRVMCYGIKHD